MIARAMESGMGCGGRSGRPLVRVNGLRRWGALVVAGLVNDGGERRGVAVTGEAALAAAATGEDFEEMVGRRLGVLVRFEGPGNCGRDGLGTEPWSIDARWCGFGIGKEGALGSGGRLKSFVEIESPGTLCVDRLLRDKLWVD